MIMFLIFIFYLKLYLGDNSCYENIHIPTVYQDDDDSYLYCLATVGKTYQIQNVKKDGIL
jgi:hypothetical protein